mmetsp:Transcript_18895/g.41148  ORF Transcript_18895/g.41148 Transcript_18895/m.41148 type:complete len:248 (-) Transcript_18895:96-839(-)
MEIGNSFNSSWEICSISCSCFSVRGELSLSCNILFRILSLFSFSLSISFPAGSEEGSLSGSVGRSEGLPHIETAIINPTNKQEAPHVPKIRELFRLAPLLLFFLLLNLATLPLDDVVALYGEKEQSSSSSAALSPFSFVLLLNPLSFVWLCFFAASPLFCICFRLDLGVREKVSSSPHLLMISRCYIYVDFIGWRDGVWSWLHALSCWRGSSLMTKNNCYFTSLNRAGRFLFKLLSLDTNVRQHNTH